MVRNDGGNRVIEKMIFRNLPSLLVIYLANLRS